MADPVWLSAARKYLGTREVHGAGTSPLILKWLTNLGAWWRDDETPWCGVFVAEVMKECGVTPPKDYYRAKSWATWGAPLGVPTLGSVVVFDRVGGGHVALAVGMTAKGLLLCLGGNQGDEVCIRAFDPARAVAYRWPDGFAWPGEKLPTLASVEESRSEA